MADIEIDNASVCIAPIELYEPGTSISRGFAAPCNRSAIVTDKNEVICPPEQILNCRILRSNVVGQILNKMYMHRAGLNTYRLKR